MVLLVSSVHVLDHMAFHLRPRESVNRGIRRLARKELKSAAKTLTDSKSNMEDAIHDARKSVKKARAVLTLATTSGAKGLRKDRKRLRRVSRELSVFRDADARVEIFDRLRTLSPTLMSRHSLTVARQFLLESKNDTIKKSGGRKRLVEAARLLKKQARSARNWNPAGRKFKPLARALHAVRQEGRRAMKRARERGDADDFHAWRKIVKAYWYQLRLLEDCGGAVRKDIRALHQLETWLGDDHNVVILCEQLFDNPAVVRACRDLNALRLAGERHQNALRRQALASGARIYAIEDKRYVKQLKQQWQVWRRQPARKAAAA
jgi:CHAD domain-containing protein